MDSASEHVHLPDEHTRHLFASGGWLHRPERRAAQGRFRWTIGPLIEAREVHRCASDAEGDAASTVRTDRPSERVVRVEPSNLLSTDRHQTRRVNWGDTSGLWH